METFTRPPPPTDNHLHSPVDPPPSTAHQFRSPSAWTTGLFGCFDDIPTCCLTCWCPCVTFGRIAEIVDQGSTACGVSGALYAMLTCFVGWSCIYSCLNRSKMRGQFNLEEEPCDDCCAHCCCECCALCQEYRELTNRGFDLSIGWHGNVARQKRLAAVQPPGVQPQMIR